MSNSDLCRKSTEEGLDQEFNSLDAQRDAEAFIQSQHSGVAGVAVTTVSTDTLVCSELVDTSSTPFSPVGRILSVIGRPNGSTPFASFNVTAFVHTTGTITLDRDPTGIVNVGDAVVIRNKSSLSSTPASVTQVTDPGYQNEDVPGIVAGW